MNRRSLLRSVASLALAAVAWPVRKCLPQSPPVPTEPEPHADTYGQDDVVWLSRRVEMTKAEFDANPIFGKGARLRLTEDPSWKSTPWRPA